MNLFIHIICTITYFIICMYGGQMSARVEKEYPLQCKHWYCRTRYKLFTWILQLILLFWVGFGMHTALATYFPL